MDSNFPTQTTELPPYVPYGVLWSVTQRCNLSCPYCHADGKSDGFMELPHDAIMRIASTLVKQGVQAITLNGGEPLLRNDIFELIGYLKGAGLWVGINSNGWTITDAVASRLAKLDMIAGVSLDGPSEMVNRKTRGAGSYQKALDAIETLLAAGVITNVLMTITRVSFNHILELTKQLYGMGVRIMVMQDFHPVGRANAVYQEFALTESQERRIIPVLSRIADRYPEMMVARTDFAVWGILGYGLKEGPSKAGPKNLFEGESCCNAMYIDASGTMYRCPSLMMLPMGNILRDEMKWAVEESEGSKEFRKLMETSVTSIPGCEECSYANKCSGGCRGDVYNLTGEWLGPHPRCPFNKAVKKKEKAEGRGRKSR